MLRALIPFGSLSSGKPQKDLIPFILIQENDVKYWKIIILCVFSLLLYWNDTNVSLVTWKEKVHPPCGTWELCITLLQVPHIQLNTLWLLGLTPTQENLETMKNLWHKNVVCKAELEIFCYWMRGPLAASAEPFLSFSNLPGFYTAFCWLLVAWYVFILLELIL